MKRTKSLNISVLPNMKQLEKSSISINKSGRKINEHQKSLAYARTIVTTIPTPLLILYPGLQIKTANKAFCKLFKVSPDEAEGKNIFELSNGQWNIPLLKHLLEDTLPEVKTLHDFEIDHFFGDIGHKIMLLYAHRLSIPDKDDPMIILAIEDITEKRSIESAVQRERRIVLENMPGGLMTLDKEWRFTYCNKKTQSIIDKKITDITGRNIWKVLPGWVGSPFDKYCCRTMKTGKPVSFEQFFPHINSWFNIEAFPSPEGLSIYFADITENKKGAEIVEFERQKMFNLFMNAPAQISVLRGPKHIFELANKPYMQMVGSKRNLIGTPIRQAIPELKQQGIFEILDNVYKTGNAFIGKEKTIKLNTETAGKTKDIVLNFVFQPYSDTNGKVQGIIAYASDITSLVNKRKRIEELSKQKDDFIGVASHELKTPVTSIKGYTQILQMRFAQEGNTKAVELLARMDGQINKLSNLIADLLDATKIKGGKLRYHKTFFDFNGLVAETVEEMQQISQRHKITMKLGETTKIFGDRDRIGQVITNLISNAVKYSPDKVEILLTSSTVKNTVRLCVQDFGIGIPEQKQEKVFNLFYRVSGNKEDTFPGMGLGLFISSEIIKRHKGKFTLKSAVGKGSTFCFFLPLKKIP